MKPIEITVGGSGLYDPAIGETDYINTNLKGVEFFVEKQGLGTVSYTDYTILSDGGFRLNTPFESGNVFYVHLTGIITTASTNGYTNGFCFNKVVPALISRIGWLQPTQEDAPSLSIQNKTSQSSRYFDDFHALVNAYNVFNIMSDENANEEQFNQFIYHLQRAVILRCLNGIFDEKELLENVLVWDRIDFNSQDKPISNSGAFVGREILIAKAADISIQIDSCILLFNQDVTFTLYLFKDGKKSPIWSKEVSAIGNEPTIINLSDLVLNYLGTETKCTRFFFGYFQDDLNNAQAIDEQHNYNKSLCFSARSCLLKNEGNNNIVRNNIQYPYSTFGLNLQVSSFRDYTSKIVAKSALFDEALGLAMTYSVLEMIVYSTRSNVNERVLKEGITKASILQELNGSAPVSEGPPAITGLNTRLKRELERVECGFVNEPKPMVVNLLR